MLNPHYSFYHCLKSDPKGMEIILQSAAGNISPVGLKSDPKGMEIIFSIFSKFFINSSKIRP
ncbi:protein of unknown function [Methanocaldococcus lauensis]|uniref:Uncharacterized protein n=1 Tax=Methanocaldococcus lauensis TaxID=2546128 RepID=A0A8D6SU76_9EURY|nr:protein of unknown function [Methanocaldococcus lauensis]